MSCVAEVEIITNGNPVFIHPKHTQIHIIYFNMSTDHVMTADVNKALPTVVSNISNDSNNVDNKREITTAFTNKKNIHLLPCKIHHDGPARVSEYFMPQQINENDGETVYEASFRGRRLAGKKMELPSNVTGIILRQQSGSSASIGDRQEQANNFAVTDDVFDRFFYWNHDIEPTETDHIPKTFQWFDIAKALHTPIVYKKESNVKASP